ncbi:hypothetical protein AB1Y20_001947 [Prymnesium parvum]|uniref:Nucleotide-diphospho-sugar transferase domain-containing protein n=1 Tax=Prymnesium parvum TaxID=97485 RepID=A0AB34J9K9_PRYPA
MAASSPSLSTAPPSSLSASRAQLLHAASPYNLLFACFTNAGGLRTTLNWVLHARLAGVRPVVGLDGPPPPREEQEHWARSPTLLFLLPTFDEAAHATRAAPRPAARRGLASRRSAQKGFQFWLVRWYGVAQLLELGVDVMLSDSDVTWHRDPRPYLRALDSAHPLLDVLIHSDHSLYAEDLREDVSYLSVASPDRRHAPHAWLIAQYQTIRPLGNRTDAPPDFDIDPRPARGYAIGTWNPGLLYARATSGGRAMIAAWMDDFAAKGRRRARPHSALSSQSEMNAFLRAAIDARHPRDAALFSVRLPAASLAHTATLGLLPAHQFGSFAATHLVREAQLFGARPYCTHATQIVGEGIVFRKNNVGHMGECTHAHWCLGKARVTAAAVKAFTQRHFGLWRVPDGDEYFSGGFLSYSSRDMRALRSFAVTSRGTAQWRRHLELLHEQLQDLQAALALALALNRTLVLPRVLCGCVYAQWPFVNEGNANCQPMHMQGLHPRLYECLPSYWLNVPELLRSGLPVREAFFLRYPRARALTRASRLSLYPCEEDEGKAFCTSRGQPLLRALPSESEARAALLPLHRVRLLHFASVRDAFGGFDAAAAAAAFASRVGRVLGAWCCKEGGKSLEGDKFPLGFSPPLGVVVRPADRTAPREAFRRVAGVNNVFGRAELKSDTACCKYLGARRSLEDCIAAAESYRLTVTSVTFHLRPKGAASANPWAGTCYGIVDGTWLPVQVRAGQAEADSARRSSIVSPTRRELVPDGQISEDLWMLPAEQ